MLLRRFALVLLVQCLMVDATWAASGFPWQNTSSQTILLQENNDLLEAAEVFNLGTVQQIDDAWLIDAEIADGHYVYRHSLQLVDGNGQDAALALPDGIARHDDFFGDTEVYLGGLLPLRFPMSIAAPVTLHWQGCSEKGICYPPQTLDVVLPRTKPNVQGSGVQRSMDTATSKTLPTTNIARGASISNPQDMAEDERAAHRLGSLSPLAGGLLFLGFGLLLAFTPCTLPMIPIVSGMIVGSQAKPRRALMLSLSYVLAMASTYAAVGVVAGLMGANLQAALQSPWLLGSFAGLFILLAASLFGMFELQLPTGLMNRLNAAGEDRAGGSLTGAALLGFISALLVGPCMTAPLAGALLYIGQTGSALIGGIALFALGLGMGLPLLAIAVFGSRFLPRPGAWMVRVRMAFGFVMTGMAVLMLSRFLSANVTLLLWAIWTLSVAFGLFALTQAVGQRTQQAWILRFGACLIALWGTLMLVGAASGGYSVLRPLEQLQFAGATELPGQANIKPSTAVEYIQVKSIEDVDARIAEASVRGQWTMIDFYADWCVSCHVIERNVFGDSRVSSRLAAMQVLRPDVTRNDDADQALMEHWGVRGPPTILLIGPDGTERRAQRTTGEVNVKNFVARLDSAGAP